MLRLVALACLGLFLAPLPWGIALNHETQECGGFWGGDEYGTYELPAGWQDYYSDPQGTIETEIGTCTGVRAIRHESVESCCQQLGYAYAGGNVGIARSSPLLAFAAVSSLAIGCGLCLAVGLVVALVAGAILLVRKNRRRP